MDGTRANLMPAADGWPPGKGMRAFAYLVICDIYVRKTGLAQSLLKKGGLSTMTEQKPPNPARSPTLPC